MKTALVLCFLLAVAAAAPQRGGGSRNRQRNRQQNRRPNGRPNVFENGPNRFQPFQQQGQAIGQANANVVNGNSNTPGGGQTSITSVSASAGGQVIGSGSSQNSASASNTNVQSPFGNFQNSQTNANSNQQGGRPCSGFFCRGK